MKLWQLLWAVVPWLLCVLLVCWLLFLLAFLPTQRPGVGIECFATQLTGWFYNAHHAAEADRMAFRQEIQAVRQACLLAIEHAAMEHAALRRTISDFLKDFPPEGGYETNGPAE